MPSSSDLLMRSFSTALGLKTSTRRGSIGTSSFGSFVVRDKGERIGRNPKTGEEVPIEPRRVLVFKPSAVLKERISKSLLDGKG